MPNVRTVRKDAPRRIQNAGLPALYRTRSQRSDITAALRWTMGGGYCMFITAKTNAVMHSLYINQFMEEDYETIWRHRTFFEPQRHQRR